MSRILTPKVYIILLNYNGWKDTIECLESILKNDYENYEVVVVDNASSNNSLEYMKKWADGQLESNIPENEKLKSLVYPFIEKPIAFNNISENEIKDKIESDVNRKLTMIKANKNRGFSSGNNVGIKYVQANGDADFIYILNNDTIVEKDFITLLVDKFNKSKNVGMISSKILHYEHPENIFCNGGKFNPWTSHIKFYNSGEKEDSQESSFNTFLSGCSWFIPIKIIDEIGYLDERYFMYVEDIDYTQKVYKKGYSLLVASDSKIYHKGAKSSGGGSSEFSVYWISKNIARYILNNGNILQKTTSILYFFYNTFKALAKSILKGKKPKTILEIKSFLYGLSDKNFEREEH